MKFKIGDKVRTYFGSGEIVFITKGNSTIQYLVKLKGIVEHAGGKVYVNEDGLRDKWWFSERQLKLLEKGEIK